MQDSPTLATAEETMRKGVGIRGKGVERWELSDRVVVCRVESPTTPAMLWQKFDHNALKIRQATIVGQEHMAT